MVEQYPLWALAALAIVGVSLVAALTIVVIGLYFVVQVPSP